MASDSPESDGDSPVRSELSRSRSESAASVPNTGTALSEEAVAAMRVRVAEIRERLAKITPGTWTAMRSGNQYLGAKYLPTARLVPTSRVEGLPRPWNPHAVIAFMKLDNSEESRFLDGDADLIANAPSDLAALCNFIDRLSSAPSRGSESDEPDGVSLIAAERKRQVEKEGWDAVHDDVAHEDGQLALAAAVYAWPAPRPLDVKKAWPWDRKWFKLTLAETEPKRCGCRSVGECEHCGTIPERAWRRARIRDLTKAGALIAAEIDRLDRLNRSAPLVTESAGGTNG